MRKVTAEEFYMAVQQDNVKVTQYGDHKLITKVYRLGDQVIAKKRVCKEAGKVVDTQYLLAVEVAV